MDGLEFPKKMISTNQKSTSSIGVRSVLGPLLKRLLWVRSRWVPAETGWTLCSSGSCFFHGQSVAGWTHSPSWRECGDELWSGWRCLVHSLQQGETCMIWGEAPSGTPVSSTANLFTSQQRIHLDWIANLAAFTGGGFKSAYFYSTSCSSV